MTIRIEKGISIPPAGLRTKLWHVYPFADLQVGDSFVMPKGGHEKWTFAFAIIQRAEKQFGIELTSRLIDDKNRRVWRTA